MTKINFSSPNYIRKQIQKSFKRFDSDGDGVSDHKDCRSLNPYKQDVKPNIQQKERIEKLPILVAQKGSTKGYHVLSKKMPKKLKRTQKIVLGVLKTRPDVIGEVERQKPEALVFMPSFKGTPYEDTYGVEVEKTAFVSATARSKNPKIWHKHELGATAIHELEHVRQEKTYKGKQYKALFKGRYSKQKGEDLAYKKEIKTSSKYYYPSQKSLNKSTKAFMEREFD